MELVELHVGHFRIGTIGHGHAFSAGDIRVTGIEVGFPRATSGQNRKSRQKCVDHGPFAVVDIGTKTAIRPVPAQAARGNQVYRLRILEQRDLRMRVDASEQCLAESFSGDVTAVGNPSLAVPSLLAEVKFVLADVIDFVALGEGDSPVHQVSHPRGSGLHDFSDHAFVAEPATRGERVRHMGFDTVIVIQDCGDSTLGLGRITGTGQLLSNNRNFAVLGRL